VPWLAGSGRSSRSNSPRSRATLAVFPSQTVSVNQKLGGRAVLVLVGAETDPDAKSGSNRVCSAQAAQTAASTSRMQSHGKLCASGCDRGAAFALGDKQTGPFNSAPLSVRQSTPGLTTSMRMCSGTNHVGCLSPLGVVDVAGSPCFCGRRLRCPLRLTLPGVPGHDCVLFSRDGRRPTAVWRASAVDLSCSHFRRSRCPPWIPGDVMV
jgi:hypothetical protein